MSESINFNKVSDIYDFYVKVDFDIPFFLKETKDYHEEILELMCGTGRVSFPLLSSGKKMVCVDYSQGMLDIFAKKNRNNNWPVELINMDVTKLELDRKFGLVILPFHSISEILSTEMQYSTLKSIAQHLNENGLLILTLQNPKTRLKNADGLTRILGSFLIDNNNQMLISYVNSYNDQEKIVSGFQFYEIYDTSGTLIEKRVLEINFKPITNLELRDMIKDLNFEIIEMYGDYSYNVFNEDKSDFMIYKMIKKLQ